MAKKYPENTENSFFGPGLKLNLGNILDLNLHIPDPGPGYRSRKGDWKARLKRTNPGFQTISPNVYRLSESSNRGNKPETAARPSGNRSGYFKAEGKFINSRGKPAQKAELEKHIEKPEHDKPIQIPEFYETSKNACKGGKYIQDREFGKYTPDPRACKARPEARPEADYIQKEDFGQGRKPEMGKIFQGAEPAEYRVGDEPVKSKFPLSKEVVDLRKPKKEEDFRGFNKGISRWKEGQKKIRLQKAQNKYRLQKEQKKRRLQKDPKAEGLKTINLKTELEKRSPDHITEVFETENKLTFLTEVPASCKKEDINLRYYFKNGEGHLIIYAGLTQRHILVNRKTALKLKGTPPEFGSLKNGVLSIEMKKS